ncbi:hypothetical protein C8R45DRAFT_991880 [Mycena sanguinolenta]|nr:hypothetical protein C8R45DRAFT_991880 [Mycena sanguinolenta]
MFSSICGTGLAILCLSNSVFARYIPVRRAADCTSQCQAMQSSIASSATQGIAVLCTSNVVQEYQTCLGCEIAISLIPQPAAQEIVDTLVSSCSSAGRPINSFTVSSTNPSASTSNAPAPVTSTTTASISSVTSATPAPTLDSVTSKVPTQTPDSVTPEAPAPSVTPDAPAPTFDNSVTTKTPISTSANSITTETPISTSASATSDVSPPSPPTVSDSVPAISSSSGPVSKSTFSAPSVQSTLSSASAALSTPAVVYSYGPAAIPSNPPSNGALVGSAPAVSAPSTAPTSPPANGAANSGGLGLVNAIFIICVISVGLL